MKKILRNQEKLSLKERNFDRKLKKLQKFTKNIRLAIFLKIFAKYTL